jgi:hypothetical protein
MKKLIIISLVFILGCSKQPDSLGEIKFEGTTFTIEATDFSGSRDYFEGQATGKNGTKSIDLSIKYYYYNTYRNKCTVVYKSGANYMNYLSCTKFKGKDTCYLHNSLITKDSTKSQIKASGDLRAFDLSQIDKYLVRKTLTLTNVVFK